MGRRSWWLVAQRISGPARADVIITQRDRAILLPSPGKPFGSGRDTSRKSRPQGAEDTFVAALTLARAASLPLTISVGLARARQYPGSPS